MHAHEDHRHAAEEAVQIEHPVRLRTLTEKAARQGPAPENSEGHDCPGDHAAATGDVPPDLVVHRVTARFEAAERSKSTGTGGGPPVKVKNVSVVDTQP